MVVSGDTSRPGRAPDSIDRHIIAELRRDGRASNQQLADRLGLSAATVSARIRRMEEAGQLRVVAVSDFAAHGVSVLLRLTITVAGRPASAVAADLAALAEVLAVHLVTGRHDIDLLVALRGYGDLDSFLLDRLSPIAGIRMVVPAVVVDIAKYAFDVAPILVSEETGPVEPSRHA